MMVVSVSFSSLNILSFFFFLTESLWQLLGFFILYLFIWLHQVLVAAHRIFF